MECALKIAPSCSLSQISLFSNHLPKNSRFLPRICNENHWNDAALISSAPRAVMCSAGRRMSSLESQFCYDKPIPEEIIPKPVGLSLAEKNVGNNPQCSSCHAKGAILCTTCAGSGLYVESILESQGIIVKVKCLGCGGSGNTMCSECGGRGHI